MTYLSKLSFSNSVGRNFLVVMLSLAGLLSLASIAQAEDRTDPPRIQQANGYTIEFVSPQAQANHDVNTQITLRFRVTDAQNQPVSGLQMNLTAMRDYSGQVTNEHNGPRTPNIGPLALTPAPQAGEYETSIRFDINGHWFLQLSGPSFKQETVKFRTPVGASDSKGAGINFDWLLWVGVLVTVLTVVTVVGRKGEVFPTPLDELEPPIPALGPTESSTLETEKLAASGPIKQL